MVDRGRSPSSFVDIVVVAGAGRGGGAEDWKESNRSSYGDHLGTRVSGATMVMASGGGGMEQGEAGGDGLHVLYTLDSVLCGGAVVCGREL